MNDTFIIFGNIVDLLKRRIFPGFIRVNAGIIEEIEETDGHYDKYIMPGFIDAHIHIESSMLIPFEFARLAAVHGTVATISDPHEIANVLGVKGVEFMLKNSKYAPVNIYFGAPSCVPASPFETAGAEIRASDVESLLKRKEIFYLSEMMNYPGVLAEDPEVMEKLSAARKYGKPVDGHAPLLSGKELEKYIKAGITTDHEATSPEEAREKIKMGMKILIREGSAAKDEDNLLPFLEESPEMCMFCSDDRHPDDLALSHINSLVKKAVNEKLDIFNVLQAACLNPVQHYSLPQGILRKNDPADFIIVDNLTDFNVIQTFLNGVLVAEGGKSLLPSQSAEPINNFVVETISPSLLKIEAKSNRIRVIRATEGSLLTGSEVHDAKIEKGNVVSNPEKDILKLVILNRYSRDAKPAIGFVRGFGLKSGAIASSIAHDSHNIVAVGVSDKALCNAINAVVESKGGISAFDGEKTEILPLPVAGIMTDRNGYEVAKMYKKLNMSAKKLGTRLNAPFMTLSFMALTVIPELKLSDRGLFDSQKFRFIDLFI